MHPSGRLDRSSVIMTDIDRIVRDVLHDPWVSRIFLAFTVGLFLSCSAEFAAGQESGGSAARSTQPVLSRARSSMRDVVEQPR